MNDKSHYGQICMKHEGRNCKRQQRRRRHLRLRAQLASGITYWREGGRGWRAGAAERVSSMKIASASLPPSLPRCSPFPVSDDEVRGRGLRSLELKRDWVVGRSERLEEFDLGGLRGLILALSLIRNKKDVISHLR